MGLFISKLLTPNYRVCPSHKFDPAREIKLAGFSTSKAYEISQKVFLPPGRVNGKGRVLAIMCVQFCVSFSPACPVTTSCPQHTVCPHDGRGKGTGSDLILTRWLHFPACCLKGRASSPKDTCSGSVWLMVHKGRGHPLDVTTDGCRHGLWSVGGVSRKALAFSDCRLCASNF